jgi:hypothetical protein
MARLTALGALQLETKFDTGQYHIEYQEQRELVYMALKYYEEVPEFPLRICDQSDPELFFPEKGQTTREAVAICKKCPEQEPCRDFAIRTNQAYGVWGGTTPRERRMLKKLTDG